MRQRPGDPERAIEPAAGGVGDGGSAQQGADPPDHGLGQLGDKGADLAALAVLDRIVDLEQQTMVSLKCAFAMQKRSLFEISMSDLQTGNRPGSACVPNFWVRRLRLGRPSNRGPAVVVDAAFGGEQGVGARLRPAAARPLEQFFDLAALAVSSSRGSERSRYT